MRETITNETAMILNKQQIKKIEEMIEQVLEEEIRKGEDLEPEDLEEIEAVAFKQKKLKKDLAEKNKELRDKLGLGTTKSKKGV